MWYCHSKESRNSWCQRRSNDLTICKGCENWCCCFRCCFCSCCCVKTLSPNLTTELTIRPCALMSRWSTWNRNLSRVYYYLWIKKKEKLIAIGVDFYLNILSPCLDSINPDIDIYMQLCRKCKLDKCETSTRNVSKCNIDIFESSCSTTLITINNILSSWYPG